MEIIMVPSLNDSYPHLVGIQVCLKILVMRMKYIIWLLLFWILEALIGG